MVCGPVATEYSVVKEQISPVPAQLRRVRVVVPYLAGIAWPRTPLAFFGNPQTFPNPVGPGRYEWLVPAVEVMKEHNWDLIRMDKLTLYNIEDKKKLDWPDDCVESTKKNRVAALSVEKMPRCVYVKANYLKPQCAPMCCPPPACGPVPMAPPPPMPAKVTK